MTKLALVVGAGGVVRFDPPVTDDDGRHVDGLHPDLKRQILGYLIETGHTFEMAADGHSLQLLSGPHLEEKLAAAAGA